MTPALSYHIASSTDVYYNLAVEEYLTDAAEAGRCILYLWQNRHTVVLGRNQNAWKECRTGKLEADGGVLSRRLSGGGAVYHDLGNLNFTFCQTAEERDVPRQQSVIARACRAFGVDAEVSGRNDLLAGGRKFSGCSFYSHNRKSFHNGTLLIDADMDKMSLYLAPSKLKLESKGVDSVRSRVVNLRELAPEITAEKMCGAMAAAFSEVYESTAQPLPDSFFDKDDILRRRDRFAGSDWIYGRLADFPLSLEERFDWGGINIDLDVRRGICADAAVYTDAMDAEFASPLRSALCGCRLDPAALCERVRGVRECGPYAADICRLFNDNI